MPVSPIIRSGDLRTENRARILRTLRREGPLPRAELGELTSLSQAAISTLTSQLAEESVLEITSPRNVPSQGTAPTRGRPQTRIALARGPTSALTVSLTIDRLRTAIVDYAGDEIASHERHLDTRSLDADTLLRLVVVEIESMARQAPNGRISQIGVAFQGTTGNVRGELLWSPIISARNVPLGPALSEHFSVPTQVNNDCALIARALYQSHADVLGPDFATILFTHGVGLGLMLDGQSFSGVRSSALEIGHLRFERRGALCRCGRRGCIEAYAADYGIARLAGNGALDDSPPGRVDATTMDAILDDALQGVSAALQAYAIAGAAVGEGLAELFTLFDPMPVALVGRSDAAFTLMADALHEALDATGRDEPGYATELHCFAASDPLLHAGLALDTLDAVDRHIAALPADATARERSLSA